MKIAIVHDWFVTYGGAERVIEQMLKLYPDADLFALCDFLPEKDRGCINHKKVTTSFIQKLPFAKKKYRSYLPFMPLAIEQLDLSGYDLIISSTHAVAKGVITGPDQLHVAYVNSPVRYAYDLMHQYLSESNLTRGPKSWLARIILHYIRMWDAKTVNGVDNLIGNSNFIARRLLKVYRRKADVIYPPVDVKKYKMTDQKDNYYVTASRLVPYKKINLIVEAFSMMPDKKLVVIGDGPDFKKIKAIATPNIKMMGYKSDSILRRYMQKAKGFVFAAEEDFGIVLIEAQACGTPVIAYGKGGALETVVKNETGVFFYKQSPEAIIDAINRFELKSNFDSKLIRRNAIRFSNERFRSEFKNYVDDAVKEFFGNTCSLSDQFPFISDDITKPINRLKTHKLILKN